MLFKILDRLKIVIIDEYMVEMLNSLFFFSDGIFLVIIKYVFFIFLFLNVFFNLLVIFLVLELIRFINLLFKYCKILSKVICLMNKIYDFILYILKF